MSTTKKPTPPPGHKRAAVRYAVQVECECGWKSGHWYGKGASIQAHGEFRWHQDQHAGSTPPEAP